MSEETLGMKKVNGEWIKIVRVFCPKCGKERLDITTDGKYKCVSCGTEFTKGRERLEN